MKALWHINEKESRILETEHTHFSDTSIEALYSLISVGTERLVANGFVPKELFSSMAVPYMDGDFSFPVKYGYSLVGRVFKSTVLKTGSLVHVMHPHQNSCHIYAKSASLVPANIPAKRAILVANMETAINAVWDSGITNGETVLIAGYGIIGALLARVCKQLYNCKVYILEQDETKMSKAVSHGYAISTEYQGLYDVAFNCTASEKALQYCIDNIKKEAAVIELSWYGMKKVSICLGGSFHILRKKLIASQVSAIPINKQSEWDYAKRKSFAFEILADEFYDVLLTNEITFEDSPDFFNLNRQSGLSGIGYYISY
jgi:NADPH:quinone reductase-like Zn-dependent oxidoreductase